MTPFDCPACGEGTVRPLARVGRVAGFRTAPALPVPEDLEIPTCDACGEEYFGPDDAARFDAAMEVVFQRFVADRRR